MVPSVDIIIVNWNAGWQLRACLKSITRAVSDGFELGRVVVVDNASSDGSADGLDELPLPLTVIRNPENRGFGTACNQGASESCPDYLLFLNPDTRLFPDSLVVPIAYMEKAENQRVAICGIQLVNDQGKVSCTCAQFPTPSMFFCKMLGLDILLPRWCPSHFMTEWDHGATREVDHVMGAFFLVRRREFEALRGFDERFFVYFEDLDLSYRARKHSWRTVYLAEAQAYHKGGGTSEQAREKRVFYSLRSRLLYGYKHFGFWSATGLLAGTLLLEPVARLVRALACRSTTQAIETFGGFAMLWISLPSILKHARS